MDTAGGSGPGPRGQPSAVAQPAWCWIGPSARGGEGVGRWIQEAVLWCTVADGPGVFVGAWLPPVPGPSQPGAARGVTGVGMRMVWLITGLVLALAGGLAVSTRWRRRRPMADDTLIAELLGPPPAGRVLPASPVREDAEPPPAPAAEPPRVPAAEPAGEGDWLQTQLAWISAWSVRMHGQITATAAGPGTCGNGEASPGERARGETGLRVAAPRAEARRLADHRSAGPPRSRAAPERCIATTVKGSQCKLPAEPGDTRCAVHAKRADP